MAVAFLSSGSRPGGQVQTVCEFLGLVDDDPLRIADGPRIHALTFQDNRLLIFPITARASDDDCNDIPPKQIDHIYQLSIPLA